MLPRWLRVAVTELTCSASLRYFAQVTLRARASQAARTEIAEQSGKPLFVNNAFYFDLGKVAGSANRGGDLASSSSSPSPSSQSQSRPQPTAGSGGGPVFEVLVYSTDGGYSAGMLAGSCEVVLTDDLVKLIGAGRVVTKTVQLAEETEDMGRVLYSRGRAGGGGTAVADVGGDHDGGGLSRPWRPVEGTDAEAWPKGQFGHVEMVFTAADLDLDADKEVLTEAAANAATAAAALNKTPVRVSALVCCATNLPRPPGHPGELRPFVAIKSFRDAQSKVEVSAATTVGTGRDPLWNQVVTVDMLEADLPKERLLLAVIDETTMKIVAKCAVPVAKLRQGLFYPLEMVLDGAAAVPPMLYVCLRLDAKPGAELHAMATAAAERDSGPGVRDRRLEVNVRGGRGYIVPSRSLMFAHVHVEGGFGEADQGVVASPLARGDTAFSRVDASTPSTFDAAFAKVGQASHGPVLPVLQGQSLSSLWDVHDPAVLILPEKDADIGVWNDAQGPCVVVDLFSCTLPVGGGGPMGAQQPLRPAGQCYLPLHSKPALSAAQGEPVVERDVGVFPPIDDSTGQQTPRAGGPQAAPHLRGGRGEEAMVEAVSLELRCLDAQANALRLERLAVARKQGTGNRIAPMGPDELVDMLLTDLWAKQRAVERVVADGGAAYALAERKSEEVAALERDLDSLGYENSAMRQALEQQARGLPVVDGRKLRAMKREELEDRITAQVSWAIAEQKKFSVLAHRLKQLHADSLAHKKLRDKYRTLKEEYRKMTDDVLSLEDRVEKVDKYRATIRAQEKVIAHYEKLLSANVEQLRTNDDMAAELEELRLENETLVTQMNDAASKETREIVSQVQREQDQGRGALEEEQVRLRLQMRAESAEAKVRALQSELSELTQAHAVELSRLKFRLTEAHAQHAGGFGDYEHLADKSYEWPLSARGDGARGDDGNGAGRADALQVGANSPARSPAGSKPATPLSGRGAASPGAAAFPAAAIIADEAVEPAAVSAAQGGRPEDAWGVEEP